MSITRRKIESKISLKKKEIQELEAAVATANANLASANAELKGINEILKIVPPDDGAALSEKKALRGGSLAERAYKILAKAGKPMHVDDMLLLIKTKKKTKKSTLANIISQYARKYEIFSRTAPNTFGLIEWGDNPPAATNEQYEIERSTENMSPFDSFSLKRDH